MDKSILKQYVSICTEIRAEEERIAKMENEIAELYPERNEVTDVVTKGRRGKKPLGTCTIHGYQDHKKINKKRAILRERKAKKELHLSQLENMTIEVEEFIYSLEESELRNILLFSCIDKKSWKDVAKSMGEGYTAEACKQAYSRFMRVK